MKLFVTDKTEMYVGTIHMNGNSTYDEYGKVLDFLHNFAGCGKSIANQILHIGEEIICGRTDRTIDVKLNEESFRYLNHYRSELPINYITWKA